MAKNNNQLLIFVFFSAIVWLNIKIPRITPNKRSFEFIWLYRTNRSAVLSHAEKDTENVNYDTLCMYVSCIV